MKVCFVGIGSIARRHIRNLVEVCAERGIDLKIDALRRSGTTDTPKEVENVFTSISEMPADYDVIFLTNPTEYHAQMLRDLHNNTKDFFIEKPIATFDTLDILQNIELRNKSVYYVAAPLRYTDIIRYIKKEINPQKINAVRCICSSYLPDWRPGQDYRNTYSAKKELGGGVDIDLIHEWDYLTFLFGFPDEVKSFSGKVSDLEIDSNDYAVYIAKYRNDYILELHLDYFGRKSERKIELYTEDDTIICDFISGKINYLISGRSVTFDFSRDLYQKRELGYFLDRISGKEKPEDDIGHAINVLKLTRGIIGR